MYDSYLIWGHRATSKRCWVIGWNQSMIRVKMLMSSITTLRTMPGVSEQA